MKRKVDNEIWHRELRQVERSTEGIIENGLGAAYRLHILVKMHRLRWERPLQRQSIE